MKKILLILVLVAIAAAGGYPIYKIVSESNLKRRVLSKEQCWPASEFTLPDLNGKSVRLEDFHGKVLVLAFWATWCAPCLMELEDLKVSHETYKNNTNVAIVTVSVDDNKALVAPHAEENGYKFPVLLSDGSVEKSYSTEAIPKLYVIDANGQIRFKVEGYGIRGNNVKILYWMIEAAMK
jgi:peroxiredoxin